MVRQRGAVATRLARTCIPYDAFGTIGHMEGGVASRIVAVRVNDGSRTARVTRFISRQTILAAFVAVIAVVFHVTGATGPTATANQSVLALAVLIGQINVPRRHLQRLLRTASVDPVTPR
jgi:hypothetical protein